MSRNKICVLTSGGVESSALVRLYLSRSGRVFPLYVRHGFRWEKAELHWLRKWLARMRSPRLEALTVLDSPLKPLYESRGAAAPSRGRYHWSFGGGKVPGWRSRDQAVFLPGRNLLLVTLAGLFCYTRDIRTVALGTLATNPFRDSTPGFFQALESALAQALSSPLKIERPFAGLHKRQVVSLIPRDLLALTFSCLDPRGVRPCRRCNKCAERARVL